LRDGAWPEVVRERVVGGGERERRLRGRDERHAVAGTRHRARTRRLPSNRDIRVARASFLEARYPGPVFDNSLPGSGKGCPSRLR